MVQLQNNSFGPLEETSYSVIMFRVLSCLSSSDGWDVLQRPVMTLIRNK